MTALEKAARAVEEVMASDDNMPEDIARAVLMAVREPTEEVARAFWGSPCNNGPDPMPQLGLNAGGQPYTAEWYGTREEFDDAFTAMIDAILGEAE